MGVKRAIGGAERKHSVGLCVKYKIQIQEYNNKCNSEGTVHVGMSMCMYIVQIQRQIQKRRHSACQEVRSPHGISPIRTAQDEENVRFIRSFREYSAKRLFSSCKRGAGGTFLAALLFSFACARNLLRSSRACSQPAKMHLIKIIFNVDDRALRGKHLD